MLEVNGAWQDQEDEAKEGEVVAKALGTAEGTSGAHLEGRKKKPPYQEQGLPTVVHPASAQVQKACLPLPVPYPTATALPGLVLVVPIVASSAGDTDGEVPVILGDRSHLCKDVVGAGTMLLQNLWGNQPYIGSLWDDSSESVEEGS